MKSSVSLHDVAKAAGVTHTTVSLVLNRRDLGSRVSQTRAKQIRQLAQQLGYVPHHAARNLKLGKTHTIAVVCSLGLRYPHVHELVEEIRMELGRRAYHLSLDLAYQPADEEATQGTLTPGRCDGVIRLGLESWARPGLLALRTRGLPIVSLQSTPDPDFDTIGTERREEGHLATDHLLAQGHRAIAVVVGPGETGETGGRVEGCRQALRAAGLNDVEPLVFFCPVEGDVRALWQQIKAARPRPTAVFIYNDELAVGLVHAIHVDGLRVPDDVALVSDSNTWVLRLADVPVSSVDHNRPMLARAAVARLLERMARPTAPPEHIFVKPHLVVRASSRKAE